LPFLAMEYVEGRTLDQIIEEGPLPERAAANVFAQVARALFESHGAGIVHRDLKPQNLVVTRLRDGEEHVKLLDFGIAKALSADPDANPLTAPGTAVGSPKYM